MYTYQQIYNLDGVTVDPDIILLLPNIYIPNDEANTDWQAYQAWLAAGNTPLPPE
jgi:hypothetical protein